MPLFDKYFYKKIKDELWRPCRCHKRFYLFSLLCVCFQKTGGGVVFFFQEKARAIRLFISSTTVHW
jgi:hypothetical protein